MCCKEVDIYELAVTRIFKLVMQVKYATYLQVMAVACSKRLRIVNIEINPHVYMY